MSSPVVGIVMGSDSDLEVMKPAAEALEELGIEHEIRVVSAHRTPEDMVAYGKSAEERGLKVIIAGAGGAAHLPGMLASLTPLPVIGVPVATVAIGAGRNAGLLAARIVGSSDEEVRRGVDRLRQEAAEKARSADAGLDRS